MTDIDDDQDMYALLGGAGKRVEPDPAIAAAIRQATEQAWRSSVAQERQRKWRNGLLGLASAAALVLAVVLWFPSYQQPRQSLARVESLAGTYSVNERARNHSEPVYAGDLLRTGHNSRLALRLNDATLVSLDAETEVTVAAPDRLVIKKGRIFVDTAGATNGLVVATSWGSIRDIGTQFEVAVSDQQLAVALREGKVELGIGGQTHTAEFRDGVGELIHVDRAMEVSRRPLAPADAHWNWTLDTRAPLNIEGLTVADVIEWSGHVTGRSVVYQTDAIATAARQRYLSGGLLQAKEVDSNLPYILKSASLAAKISAATIVVDEQFLVDDPSTSP